MIQDMLADLPALLVILAALVLAAVGGWPITALVLRWSRSPRRARPERSGREVPLLESPSHPTREWSTPELLRGGLWIGLLERLAVVATVLAGRPELIAVVVALKGLGRYPELRSQVGASERFLVGTFASLLWSVGVGALALAVLGALG